MLRVLAIVVATVSCACCVNAAPAPPIMEKIHQLLPAIKGDKVLTLAALQQALGIRGAGRPDEVQLQELRDAGVVSKFQWLQFRGKSVRRLQAEDVRVDVYHSENGSSLVDRVVIEVSSHECIDSAPIISKYQLSPYVLPPEAPPPQTSGIHEEHAHKPQPPVLFERYENNVGLGMIWITTERVASFLPACMTSIAARFGKDID
jgi:hypothetical protein